MSSTEFSGRREKCLNGGSEFKAGSVTSFACSGKNGTFEGGVLPAGKSLSGLWAAASYGEEAFPEPGVGA
ncbi:MAG: hypothetical protein WBV85_08525, partial [Solirubrobacteraceae bacterium]